MADEAQIVYEYINGSSVSIKTNDLKISIKRLFVQITARPDDKIHVLDPGIIQRTFTGTGTLTGANAKILHDVQVAAITYDGTYPRIQKIYWTGAATVVNVPVFGQFDLDDLGSERWNVSFTLTEYKST